MNYDANGMSIEKYAWVFDKKILLPAGNYYLSANSSLLIRAVVIDDKNIKKTFYVNSKVIVPENVAAIQLLIGTPDIGTSVNEKDISIMLNSGEVAVKWRPYVEGSVMLL